MPLASAKDPWQHVHLGRTNSGQPLPAPPKDHALPPDLTAQVAATERAVAAGSVPIAGAAPQSDKEVRNYGPF